MNEKWRSFVTALNDLGLKLSTSYNIETIINPLDVQISEAIMNFQENAQNISQHVYHVCGRPMPSTDQNMGQFRPATGRLGKRAARPEPIPILPTLKATSNHNRHGQQQLSKPNHSTSSLTLGGHLRAASREGFLSSGPLLPEDLTPIGQKSPRLIEEIKNYILSTKSFWSSYPNAVCTNNYTLGSNTSSLARRQINCFREPFQLSDVNSDLRYRGEISKLVSQLESMKNKIVDALGGIEIDWSSVSTEKSHPMVPTPLLTNSRFVHPLTTTTTTTPSPESDDHEEVDPNSDDNFDQNSGNYDETTKDPDDIDPDDVVYTDESHDEDFETTTEIADIDDESNSDTTASANSNTDHQDNSIDHPLQPNLYDSQNLITPPTQSDAQRSSFSPAQRSSQSVGLLLLLLLASVCNLAISLNKKSAQVSYS